MHQFWSMSVNACPLSPLPQRWPSSDWHQFTLVNMDQLLLFMNWEQLTHFLPSKEVCTTLDYWTAILSHATTAASAVSSSTHQWQSTHLIIRWKLNWKWSGSQAKESQAEAKQNLEADAELMIKGQKLNSLVLHLFSALLFNITVFSVQYCCVLMKTRTL